MPAAQRTPLDLIALLARRGPQELHAVAELARGEHEPDDERLHALVRAGVLRAGDDRPKVPAGLLVPALALDGSLGLSGPQLTGQLVQLLAGSSQPRTRDILLDTLTDQLRGHLDDLDGDPSQRAEVAQLRDALSALTDALTQLDAADADPVAVTRLAGLCARLIERVAHRTMPKRPRTPKPLPAPPLSSAQLAAVASELAFALPAALRLPRESALAAALQGPRPRPELSRRHVELAAPAVRVRRAAAQQALRDPDPVSALYGSAEEAQEALARHAALIALGADALYAHGWRPAAGRREGPAPLQWSTPFEPVRDRGRAKELAPA